MDLCRATNTLQERPPCLQTGRWLRSSPTSGSIIAIRRQRRWPSLLRALTAVLVSVGTATGAAATGPRWGSPGLVGGGRGQGYPSRSRDEQQSTACVGANIRGSSAWRHPRGAIAAAFVSAYGGAAATAAAGIKNKPQAPKACSSRVVGWGGKPSTRQMIQAGGAPAAALRALPASDGDSGVAGARRLPQRRSRAKGGDWRPSLYMTEGIFQALPFPVRITVMGGGNFGLALSLVLARNQIPTTLLVRTDSVAEYVNTHNEHPNYLKGIKLPRHIVATADSAAALKDATYIIHAVPVQYTRKFLANVAQHIPPGAPIMSVSKGIETSSLMLMNDILKEACGNERSYAFLSGPSFAREIAMNQATAVVIASDDSCLANDMAKVLSSPTFRCFTSKDVIGVEVGGAVKNVIALAAGMCEGLGLGTNAMAGLVTRGCGEMRRMAVILGGKSRTLSGLSGVGDTFGTCFGPLSRNRNFGIRLGKGESMEEILASSTEVAEGVDTALALADLIRKIDKSYRIDLKYAIIFGVADILKGERSPKEGLEDLMTMPLRAEMYDSL